MKLYIAFDVHASSRVLAVVDDDGKRIGARKIRIGLEKVVETLEPMRDEIMGVVVENTYKCYWMVYAVVDAGYRPCLANPGQIQKYKGLRNW